MHFPELLQVGSLKLDVHPAWPEGCMRVCLCKWPVGSRLGEFIIQLISSFFLPKPGHAPAMDALVVP